MQRCPATSGDARSQRPASMLGFVPFDDGAAPDSVAGVIDALRAELAIRREPAELAEVLERRAHVPTRPSPLAAGAPLHVHGTYGRAEAPVALGDRRLGPATRVEDRGEKPVAITWRLARPMPETWFAIAKAAAG